MRVELKSNRGCNYRIRDDYWLLMLPSYWNQNTRYDLVLLQASSQGPPVSAVVYTLLLAGGLSTVRPAPLWLFSEFGADYKYTDLLTYLLRCILRSTCRLHTAFIQPAYARGRWTVRRRRPACRLHTRDCPASMTGCPVFSRVYIQLQAVNQFSLHNLCTSWKWRGTAWQLL